MIVYLGADHRGFHLKEHLKIWLEKNGYTAQDLGDTKEVPTDDYVDFAKTVAEHVAKDRDSRGIVICGSGVGVDITANKVDGIRCGFGYSVEQVTAGRADDDINVLALAADEVSIEQAEEMVKAFLETEFVQSESHVRRLEKLKKLE